MNDTMLPKVFISYSHDSPEHEDAVLYLANQLWKVDGIECMIDQFDPAPKEGWPRWMEGQIEQAQYIIIICTETYKRRVELKEEPGKGHGVLWESNLIYNELYASGTVSKKYIPILLNGTDKKFLLKPMQSLTYYEFKSPGCTLDNSKGYEKLYRYLTDQPEIEIPKPGQIKKLSPKTIPNQPHNNNHTHFYNVPPHNPFFTGRETYLKKIEDTLKAKSSVALTQSYDDPVKSQAANG